MELPELEEDEGVPIPQLVIELIRCHLTPVQREIFNNSIPKTTLADNDENKFPAMVAEAVGMYEHLLQA